MKTSNSPDAPGEQKSGIPESVDTPAPVNTTTLRRLATPPQHGQAGPRSQGAVRRCRAGAGSAPWEARAGTLVVGGLAAGYRRPVRCSGVALLALALIAWASQSRPLPG